MPLSYVLVLEFFPLVRHFRRALVHWAPLYSTPLTILRGMITPGIGTVILYQILGTLFLNVSVILFFSLQMTQVSPKE